MSGPAGAGPWSSPDAAPPTEADPLAGEDIWVTARHAAEVLARDERWVEAQCQAGRLPWRRKAEGGAEVLLVPMAATRELATQGGGTAS